jgi:DUF1009 family protein
MHIGIIAGGGQFPALFAQAATSAGYTVVAAAHINETAPELADHVDDILWVHLGQLKKIIRFFKKHHVRQAVMLGTITKTRIFTDVRPDIKAIALVAKMRHTLDDGILRAVAGAIESEGIAIEASTFLLPELLAPAGHWTSRRPDPSEMADISLGWRIAKEIGHLDIGQCVVVAGGSVLAVEAVDGTDATITRGGSLAKGQAVVVKVCKPNQDFRFDVPAIGAKTIATMAAVGATALAVEAGRAVVFDRNDMVARAEAAGIAIVALDGPPDGDG